MMFEIPAWVIRTFAFVGFLTTLGIGLFFALAIAADLLKRSRKGTQQ